MDEAVAQCIRIRYLEHALESRDSERHSRALPLELGNTPLIKRFDPSTRCPF